MENANITTGMKPRKRLIRGFSAIFIIIVIILTFFSKTINNFLLPEVECGSPRSGILQTEIRAKGEVRVESTEKIFAYGDWRVTNVRIKEGSTVKKGEELARVEVGDVKLDVKRKELDIIKLENELQKYRENFQSVDLETYERKITQAGKDAAKAERELETATTLYESGAESRKSVGEAEEKLEKAKLEYETVQKELENKKDEIIRNSNEYQRYINEKEAELQLKNLEFANLQSKLPKDGIIRSPIDGFVKTISTEKGATSSSGQVLFEITGKSSEITIQWKLNANKSKELKEGGRADFELKDDSHFTFDGKITEKRYLSNEDMYIFISRVKNDKGNLKDGQEVEVNITKKSREYRLIVPKNSVVKQSGKDAVFVLKERGGALGEEHYVEMIYVRVEETDDFDAAISGVIDTESRVVSYWSKELVDKAQVKLR
ncbi:MAG: efflux RND transporter periplasmic adaptor subunit [Clostridia bacterium]|nr:efflux RND transporter periplasmic adaptor subunit [Clostridia bacterium]